MGTEKQLQLHIDEATSKGIYSNFVIVSHSMMEVTADFAFVHTAPPRAKVESRIIMSPIQAKRLLRTLAENLRKYEDTFGEIPSGNDESLH
jgi:Protein of unknown function (DUF3467)